MRQFPTFMPSLLMGVAIAMYIDASSAQETRSFISNCHARYADVANEQRVPSGAERHVLDTYKEQGGHKV